MAKVGFSFGDHRSDRGRTVSSKYDGDQWESASQFPGERAHESRTTRPACVETHWNHALLPAHHLADRPDKPPTRHPLAGDGSWLGFQEAGWSEWMGAIKKGWVMDVKSCLALLLVSCVN